MDLELDELYQELIIDHGTQPRNHGTLTDATNVAEGYNPLCGDKVKLYLLLQDNIVTKVKFEGKGCAISVASSSIMSEMLIGKTKKEALELFTNFTEFITKDESNKTNTDLLGKLVAFESVKKFPSRIKCATLVWHTLDDALSP